MPKNSKSAFIWIVKQLQRDKIPFQVTGGLAARVYGSKRLLNDIDLEFNSKYLDRILPKIKLNIVYGPKFYRRKPFQVMLTTLKYKGQLIDLSCYDTEELFDNTKSKWIKYNTILSKSKKRIFGILTPIVSKRNLIRYKKQIGRRVDRIDVVNLTN